MKQFVHFLFFFVSVTCICLGQKQKNQDINEQFESLYNKSKNYKDYKIVKFHYYETLKKNILDSIESNRKKIYDLTQIIKTKDKELKLIKINLLNHKKKLENAISMRNTSYIFGIEMNKSVFSAITILSQILLISLLGYYIYQYRANISTRKSTVFNFEKLKTEFDEYKNKSLIRFQEVNRKLQDQLNKKVLKTQSIQTDKKSKNDTKSRTSDKAKKDQKDQKKAK